MLALGVVVGGLRETDDFSAALEIALAKPIVSELRRYVCHFDYVHRRGAEQIRYEVRLRDCHSERRSEGREYRSERVPSGRIE